MFFKMSKTLLENLAGTADVLVRVFAFLAAISALAYLLSSRQLQKINKHENEERSEAENRQAGLEAEISRAHGKLEELKSENLRLAAQAEQEHEARLQIQRRFGPRTVSSPVSSEIVAALRPFVGQKINFGYFTELETAAFAQQILDTLKAAGWRPQVFKLKSMQPLYGIECGGPNPDDPALRSLTDALRLIDKRATVEDSGTFVMGQALPAQQTDQLWVMVGLKRPHLRLKAHPEESGQQSDQETRAGDRN